MQNVHSLLNSVKGIQSEIEVQKDEERMQITKPSSNGSLVVVITHLCKNYQIFNKNAQHPKAKPFPDHK
ncbi:hypothetical protein T01_11430 [Trichinella spiralis]|uniref:Uncharacterized protein n=1 Tax=Trichinella spiralis TaxID=6334 RepID=A0A0V1BSH0_TRISP|nr:hypothetical protein T01_11430 [Trichinella spiralis]